jgi:hypothetical protein
MNNGLRKKGRDNNAPHLKELQLAMRVADEICNQLINIRNQL